MERQETGELQHVLRDAHRMRAARAGRSHAAPPPSAHTAAPSPDFTLFPPALSKADQAPEGYALYAASAKCKIDWHDLRIDLKIEDQLHGIKLHQAIFSKTFKTGYGIEEDWQTVDVYRTSPPTGQCYISAARRLPRTNEGQISHRPRERSR